MELEKVDHIGIAVNDLDDALTLYTDVLKLKVIKIEEFPDLQVKVAFMPVGEVLIELVQPMGPDAPLAKRIREQGEGLYHITYRVKDIYGALKEMKESGIAMRDNEVRPGGMGSKIAFSKPDSTNNVIIELVERSEEI